MVATSILAEAVVSGILIGIFYALVASGFSMIWAAMKMVNVAHAVFMVAASYIAMQATSIVGLDLFTGLLVITPVMFVLGAVVYRTVLSYSYRSADFEVVSIIATFGLAIVVENALLYLFGPTQRSLESSYSGAIAVSGITFEQLNLISGVIALFATLGLYVLIYRTGIGRAVRSTWQDESLAVLHGIDPERTRLVMFSLATALAGVAGVLLPIIRSVNPSLHWDYIVVVFIIVIVGGVGSIVGTLTTGTMVGLIEEAVPLFIPSSWVPVLLYMILMAFLLAKPDGIFEGVA